MKHLRTAYFIVANTAILLLLLEAGAYVAIRTYQRVASHSFYEDLTDEVRRNYAHMTPADVNDLLRVTRSLRLRYAPLQGFVEEARASRFVNIDARGIRVNGETHRDVTGMQDAIWFFGGSTTLGYGVADRETIPAQLEQLLRRPVLNLGVRADAGLMENQRFGYYLRVGYRPAMAIFLDGINEACPSELFEDQLSTLVAGTRNSYTWEFGRPISYGYARLRERLERRSGANVDRPEPLVVTCVDDGTRTPLRTIHARTLAERDARCRLYDIACRTFVQPFPGLHGRHDELRPADTVYMRDLFDHLEDNWRTAGATFVTAALNRIDHHAFVDSAHYSAEGNRLIAEAIARQLEKPPVSAP